MEGVGSFQSKAMQLKQFQNKRLSRMYMVFQSKDNIHIVVLVTKTRISYIYKFGLLKFDLYWFSGSEVTGERRYVCNECDDMSKTGAKLESCCLVLFETVMMLPLFCFTLTRESLGYFTNCSETWSEPSKWRWIGRRAKLSYEQELKIQWL